NHGLALLFFICALLSKTAIIALPGVFVLLVWWKRERIKRQDLAALVPFVLSGVVLGLFTVQCEVAASHTQTAEWHMTVVERCLVAGRALWFYAGKLIWPHPVMAIYPRWNISGAVWWQYVFPVSAIGTMLTLW